MKRFILIMLSLVIVSLIATNSLNNSARMPRDGFNQSVQAPMTMQLYDGDQTGLEHLAENTFATHATWDANNDFVDSGGDATWTYADTARSYITQANADQALAVRNAQSLLFTYDLSSSDMNGTVTAWITGICDSLQLDTTVGTGKTQAITTKALADTTAFVLWVKPATATAGSVVFDNLYLTSYYESPITIATGEDVTLTTPVNAVELIIDPQGTDVKIEVGSAYFLVNTLFPIPVVGTATVKIANDSGATATVYTCWNKL